MKRILILLAFFAVIALGSNTSHAQTAAQDSLTADTSGAYNSGNNNYNNSITNLVDDIANWITTTVWDNLKSLVTDFLGSGVEGGFESLGDDISSAFSWLGTKHKGDNFSTLSSGDSSVMAANGIGTTGSVGGSSFVLMTGNGNTASIVGFPTLGQNVTYTIPDPHSATASFVLNAGPQEHKGSQTFDTAVTLAYLTANQAVVTDNNKKLISLAYGSSNAASSLVERDNNSGFSANGTISAGTISASHVIAAAKGTAAETGSGVNVNDNPVFIITGSAGGTQTSHLPGGVASGDVIIVINESTTTEQFSLGQTASIAPGGSRTFYYDGTSWQ